MKLIAVLLVWSAFALSASATMAFAPISPDDLASGAYSFSVSTNAAGGLSFHVIVNRKKDVIYPDSGVDLSVLSTNFNFSKVPVTVPITLKKETHQWTADFVMSREILKTEGLCFVFSEFGHVVQNGKTIAMPSVLFHYIKVRDLLENKAPVQ